MSNILGISIAKMNISKTWATVTSPAGHIWKAIAQSWKGSLASSPSLPRIFPPSLSFYFSKISVKYKISLQQSKAFPSWSRIRGYGFQFSQIILQYLHFSESNQLGLSTKLDRIKVFISSGFQRNPKLGLSTFVFVWKFRDFLVLYLTNWVLKISPFFAIFFLFCINWR